MNGYCIVLCFSYWNRSLKKNGRAWAVSFIPYWFRAWTKRWQIIVLSTCVQYSICDCYRHLKYMNFLHLWYPEIPWSLEYSGGYSDFLIYIFRMDIAAHILRGKCLLSVCKKNKREKNAHAHRGYLIFHESLNLIQDSS